MSAPSLFGSYLLLRPLGEGSISEVYLAQTPGEYSRLCAIKLIRPEIAAMPDFAERFRRDAALLLRLVHGNLVQVLEVGSVEERLFIAMEFIDGITLEDLVSSVTEDNPLPPELGFFVGLEMCEALNYIQLRRQEASNQPTFPHDEPWPLEVMLSRDGVVKIADLGSFGAVRLGQQQVTELFRCPGYSIPEVITRRPLDARSDVFAVGVMVWEILQGRALLSSEPERYVHQILDGTWRAPTINRQDVPGDVIRAVAQMLSLKPEERPPTLKEARKPLVAGLRRVAPAYGSAEVAKLINQRERRALEDVLALSPKEVDEVLEQRLRAPPSAGTLSFGRSGKADRQVDAPQELIPGERIPGTRYKMLRFLGEGGNAEVYAGQHIDLERQLAIKIIHPELARSSSAIDFFRREARACSRVGHPNIVEVIDFGELTDGRFFFAMELLNGESLAESLDREERLSPGRAIGVFRQIARALQAVHRQGIVHRDLKPANVMLVDREDRQDFVKVLDFGCTAFDNEAGEEPAGTPGFMAPELVQGAPPRPAMDIYATGVMLYLALSGRLPFPATSYTDFVEQQKGEAPPALRSLPGCEEIPAALERVVHKALERSPEARHQSMADFEADLLQAQQEAGLVSQWDDLPAPDELRDRRPGRATPATAALKTSKWRVAGGVAAGVGAIIVAAVLLLSGDRATEPGNAPASTPAPVALNTEPLVASPAKDQPGDHAPPHSPASQPAPAPPAAAPAPKKKSPPRSIAPPDPTKKRAKPPVEPPKDKARDPARSRELLVQGKAQLNKGKMQQARQLLLLALGADPRNCDAMAGLAAVAFERDQNISAVEWAQKTVRTCGRHLRAHQLMGDAYFNLMRYADARRAWQRVLTINPGNKRALQRLEKLGNRGQ